MAKFEIEHKGKRYEIEAPDEKSAMETFEEHNKSFMEKLPIIGSIAKANREVKEATRDYINKNAPEKVKDYDEKIKTVKNLESLSNIVAASGAMTMATGPGLLAGMFGQGGLGAGVTLADRASEKGITNLDKDDAKRAALSGAISTLGPVAGRILSPFQSVNNAAVAARSGKPEPKSAYEALRDKIRPNFGMGKDKVGMGPLDELLKKEAATKAAAAKAERLTATSEKIQSIINTGTGGGLGLMLGGPTHAILGALAGYALPKVAPKIAPHLAPGVHNNIFGKPVNQSILNALGIGAGTSIADAPPI